MPSTRAKGHVLLERPQTLVFGGLFFDVVDDEHGGWASLFLEFQSELLIDGVE